MKLTEENVLRIQHEMIRNSSLWGATLRDRDMIQMTMYICGINDTTEALLEELRKDGDADG